MFALFMITALVCAWSVYTARALFVESHNVVMRECKLAPKVWWDNVSWGGSYGNNWMSDDSAADGREQQPMLSG